MGQPPAKKKLPPKAPPAIKREHYMEVPAGIFLRAILRSSVSTATNNINDPVSAILDSNYYFIDTVCIPENSILDGHISEFQLPKKGRNGYFRIHFDSIRFPDNKQMPLDGNLWLEGSDLVGGQTTSLNEMRPVHFSAGGMNYLLLKPTGEYSIGKDVTLPAGSEILVKTNQSLKVNFLE
jgi:hypothetical protein